MKKGITTLIKLHKRTVDELRKQLVAVENQKQQLLDLSAKLANDLKEEMKLSAGDPTIGKFFGEFAKRVKKRREDIVTEVTKLDKKIAELAEEIAVAFGELKKFEIAQENALKREAAEANRKETIRLDDVAGDQHRRKENN